MWNPTCRNFRKEDVGGTLLKCDLIDPEPNTWATVCVRWLTLSLILLWLWIAISIVQNRFFHRLSHFPGPFLASSTNLWKVYHVYVGDLEHVLLEAHRKYGKTVRIGPNHLDFSDASAVKTIYGSGREFPKSTFYDAFTALRPNLFGVRDEEVHSARRKACSNGFSLQSVAAMEPFMDGCLWQLLHRLDQAAVHEEGIDLKEWIAFFVLDVLGELAFSGSFGILESGDATLMPPIREHVLLATTSGQLPWLIPYINKVVPYLPIPALQRMIRGRAGLRALAVTSVEKRVQSKSRRKDLLGRLLQELDQGYDSKGNELDIKDIQTEAFGFIVAGSHTTAATITLLLWHLFRNPDVLKRLQNEIRTGAIHNDGSCHAYANVANLPYLQACVTESFRMSPVFVIPLMRVVPPGGKVIAGEFVPSGTDVSICSHVLHHDAIEFGENLDKFIPERWLDESNTRSQYLMPFGAGHRACLGRNIATTEIYKVVASLLSRYEFDCRLPTDDMDQVQFSPNTKSFGVADLVGKLMVKVTRRN
ncbi:cytochrome P450 [Cadophora sp. MPI-SDFR-AT-0126]|nr:cytochrome P450 [Leotiomycetes sp. MPI-SDFR-AT-0126]